jgi:hypothetical protein
MLLADFIFFGHKKIYRRSYLNNNIMITEYYPFLQLHSVSLKVKKSEKPEKGVNNIYTYRWRFKMLRFLEILFLIKIKLLKLKFLKEKVCFYQK